MPVLELPGGGITTPKYDRVVASSLEELTAFRPEVPHVWGLVRGQFTRRYWDGVEWKVAGVIGSGPLASAPVASASNQNLYYASTDFGLCFCRRIVLLNGPDTLTFLPVSSNLKSIDWELSFGFRDDNLDQTSYSRHLQLYASGTANLFVVANTSGQLEFAFRNNGSTTIHMLTLTSQYSDAKPHRITMGMRSGLFCAHSEKETEKTLDVSLWTGTGFTSIVVSDQNLSSRPLGFFNIRQSAGALLDCFPCDDALGTTLIANQCTPSRPATLSDSTAHAYSWVPVALQ